ncbi:transposase, partial [candidate division MSBL1 archaeon SCGC-AAA259B11]
GILDCVEFQYTPVHGSWLNMAEIEISIMETECLGRRLPDIQTLGKELKAWEGRRNEKGKMIDWRFSREDAKKKFDLETGQN